MKGVQLANAWRLQEFASIVCPKKNNKEPLTRRTRRGKVYEIKGEVNEEEGWAEKDREMRFFFTDPVNYENRQKEMIIIVALGRLTRFFPFLQPVIKFPVS